ncbi:MAG TPA: GtrA family protein [Clostridia bacterium]
MLQKIKNRINAFSQEYPKAWEIIKFLAAGGIAALVDMSAMALVIFSLNKEVFSYNLLNVFLQSGLKKDRIARYSSVLGTSLGFLAGVIVNYILSVNFVFQEKGFAKTAGGAALFFVLSAIGFFTHTLGMWAFFEKLKINYWIVKTAITLFVLVFNYFTRKIFIFGGDKKYIGQNNASQASCPKVKD